MNVFGGCDKLQAEPGTAGQRRASAPDGGASRSSRSACPLSDEGVVCKSLPNLTIGLIQATGDSTEYERLLPVCNDDTFMLGIVVSGEAVVVGPERSESRIGAGTAIFQSGSSVRYRWFTSSVEFLFATTPRGLLVPSLIDPYRARFSIVYAGSSTVKLLTGYLQFLLRENIPSYLQPISVTHVHDLAAMALGPREDTPEPVGRRGLRVARLRAVKADIEENLADHDLTIDALARRHGISPRSLRELFGIENTTFTEYVLRLRLNRVHNRLLDARYSHYSISALAFETGFGDLSYFNHAFRNRFGATPSDIRKRAPPDRSPV